MEPRLPTSSLVANTELNLVVNVRFFFPFFTHCMARSSFWSKARVWYCAYNKRSAIPEGLYEKARGGRGEVGRRGDGHSPVFVLFGWPNKRDRVTSRFSHPLRFVTPRKWESNSNILCGPAELIVFVNV